MRPRLFTPVTARRALEDLRESAETMCRLFRAAEGRRPALVQPDGPVDRGYFRLVEQLTRVLARLDQAGVRVKDPRVGLLDFPARRAGRAVLLCWQVGESAIEHWHEEADGYAGRRPVDDDGPWEADGSGS